MSDVWHSAIAASPGGYRAYRRARAAVLARDGYRCRLGPMRAQRGAPDVCVHVASQAHHLDGTATGSDPSRMVASCKPCNVAEGDPTQRGHSPAATVDAWWLRTQRDDDA